MHTSDQLIAGEDLAIEHRDIESLIPYARNARTHSDKQIAEIAASIREFGWTKPVLVDGENGIIAGHGRVLTGRTLGGSPLCRSSNWRACPRRRSGPTCSPIINSPRMPAGTGRCWPPKSPTWSALGIDVDVTGFGAGQVDKLLDLHQQGSAATLPDEAPEPPALPVSRAGDLWLLGEHRLLCGDATSADDVEKALGGALADMTFADPPYNVDYEGKTSKRLTIANDALGSDFASFLERACVSLLRVTKGAIYICMSSAELGTVKKAFEAAAGHWSTFVIWSKNAFTLGRADYHRQYEPILYGWPKGSNHYWCGARDQGDVWLFDRPVCNDLHTTMKPIGLVERAIRNSSKTRDIILDPFAGSGTTGMAAEATGRRAVLLEVDPRYCDVIVQRWQEGTGKTARLQSDGRTFEEIAAERLVGTSSEALA